MNDILTYYLIKVNIFIYDLITIVVLYLVCYIMFIDMYNLMSVDVLNNNDNGIGSVYKHKMEQKYRFGTVWIIIRSNNNIPNKHCIPTVPTMSTMVIIILLSYILCYFKPNCNGISQHNGLRLRSLFIYFSTYIVGTYYIYT